MAGVEKLKGRRGEAGAGLAVGSPIHLAIIPEALKLGFKFLDLFVVEKSVFPDAALLPLAQHDVDGVVQDAPGHSLRLFSAYDLTERLSLGGSLDYLSGRVPSSTPDSNGFWQEVPGYTTLSALARYQLSPTLGLQLNVEKLLNRHFYDGLDDNHVVPGAGRSVRLTLAFRQ